LVAGVAPVDRAESAFMQLVFSRDSHVVVSGKRAAKSFAEQLWIFAQRAAAESVHAWSAVTPPPSPPPPSSPVDVAVVVLPLHAANQVSETMPAKNAMERDVRMTAHEASATPSRRAALSARSRAST
jgi:hypothetical protein